MTANDIVLYKALYDGTISNEIVESGVLNSLLDDVSPTEAEFGIDKYNKFFIKNTNQTEKALNLTVSVCKFTDGDDSAVLTIGTDNDISYPTGSKEYGVLLATSELDRVGKTIQVATENTQPTEIFQVGDRIVFIDKNTLSKIVYSTVSNVTDTEITINEDIPTSYVLNDSYIASCITIDELLPNSSIPIWVKRTVPSFSSALEIPPNSVNLLIIMD